MPMEFQPLLHDIHTILKSASSKCSVLDEKFPGTFFEAKPEKIYASYVRYMERRTTNDGEVKNGSRIHFVTINGRFESGEYLPEQGGFYKLYHDIKLVCTNMIHFYPTDSKKYQLVDQFYKFATELLLRECYKIGILLTSEVGTEESSDKDPIETNEERSELDKAIAKDFLKISTSYRLPLRESYHVKTKDMDLFTSVINKSSLDHRPRELPDKNFEVNKIIPQANPFEEAPRLGFIAANTSNIPDPTLPPTEMMSKFLHPNWYSLPTTSWLKYGDYASWAPAFNEDSTVLDSTSSGIIWLKRIGYLTYGNKRVGQEKEAPESAVEDKIITENVDKKEGILEKVDSKVEEVDIAESVAQQDNKSDANAVRKEDIKLENLFSWKPLNCIESDEITSFKEGTQQDLVTETLLKIRKLRQDRVSHKISKPSVEETKLYFKVRRILKEVIVSKQLAHIPTNHQRSFPILQANYTGNIPVVRAQTTRKRKYNKTNR
ncbi:Rsc58p KNAG_0A06010 [Huiozyma naganishii CBS 8797]|uniref:Uncharacterized protein n=1 Tax=Huiozyma naganishii (strain ATCC MYA-139 / BCRC 22969 / CBS 8797 / KCTC 17520 / NBRC 10181 / NCYC 3082 / Yp74L-3) TaxID=1071383 RepID=J7RFC9_HUIN7|nr:hypothetical protein KNAG_0A06010 [Kazachstania naganishii CBS 8797]CCK68263.1 hypothetical protein KNAG_0A06010 [Kazachstania naganishii CBS 8797]